MFRNMVAEHGCDTPWRAPQDSDFDRIQERTVERIADIPVPQVVEELVQKTVEVPQVQFLDKVVDMTVVMQRLVPMVQPVQKTMEVLTVAVHRRGR